MDKQGRLPCCDCRDVSPSANSRYIEKGKMGPMVKLVGIWALHIGSMIACDSVCFPLGHHSLTSGIWKVTELSMFCLLAYLMATWFQKIFLKEEADIIYGEREADTP